MCHPPDLRLQADGGAFQRRDFDKLPQPLDFLVERRAQFGARYHERYYLDGLRQFAARRKVFVVVRARGELDIKGRDIEPMRIASEARRARSTSAWISEGFKPRPDS